MSDFNFALAFGALVIVVFAYDQFKRPSYPASQELTRLIEFIGPADMRKGGVFYRAYAAYASILLLIYFLICFYTPDPVLKTLGIAISVLSDGDTPQGRLLNPVLPLTVSLLMVGLAPGVPFLQKFEAKVRFAAHHLSGIPARLVHGCRILQARSLGLPQDGSGLLIPPKDWERMRLYRRSGALVLSDPDDFSEDMAKIIAFRSWVLRHQLNVTALIPRPGIDRIQTGVKARIERLILGLDLLAGTHSKDQAADGNAAPAEPDQQSREAWANLAVEAGQLCADVCALMMLEVEHGLIASGTGRHAGEMAVDPLPDTTDQTEAARRKLTKFLTVAENWANDTALVGLLWVRATLAAVAITFVWTTVFADQANSYLHPLRLGVLYAFSAFLIYSLAILVALTVHGRQMRAAEGRPKWPNMVSSHWTRWIGPVVGLFLISAAASLSSAIVVNLIGAINAVGPGLFLAKFGQGLVSALQAEGARALLGPVLAIGVVASVDAWKAGGNEGRKASLRIMLATVLAMALWAPFTLLLTEQYYLHVNEVKGCVEAGLGNCDSIGFRPLAELFFNRVPLIIAASARATLIGFAVLYICQQTLSHGLEADQTEGNEAVPGQADGVIPLV